MSSYKALDTLKTFKEVNVQAPQCLFFVLLMLSFCLSLSNVSDEEKINKTLPIISLIAYSFILVLLIMSSVGLEIANEILATPMYQLVLFLVVVILSFLSSAQNVSDEKQENKSFSIIVLIVNSLIILSLFFNMWANWKSL